MGFSTVFTSALTTKTEVSIRLCDLLSYLTDAPLVATWYA
jgi:hypothetical protein